MMKLIVRIVTGIRDDLNAPDRWGNDLGFFLFVLMLAVGLIAAVFGLSWGIITVFPGISKGAYALLFAAVVGVMLLACYLINLLNR